jgi:glycosyltransferase involved in cell wall biosynthesis
MRQLEDMGKWKIKKFFIVIKKIRELIFELHNYKPDLVYFQISLHGFAFFRDLLFVCIIKLLKVKIAFHLHGKGIKDKSFFSKKMYKFCFKNEYLIFLSSLIINDVEDVFTGKSYIVPNGIPDIINLYNKKEGKENINILFLSNFIESKGILDFISMLKILTDEGCKFTATIVGADADFSFDQIKERLLEAGLDSFVQLLGPKYGKEKEQILLRSDIFVFPTKNDIWGNVLLEAMQFSLPIISTKEGAIPEIVDEGITGFLVEKNHPEELAKKIEILLTDAELRKKMGNFGRKKYEEKYTLQQFENNMKNVFDRILNDISLENKVIKK